LIIGVSLRPAASLGSIGVTCLDLSALYRPHERQYIALHKKGKPYFAMHPNHGKQWFKMGHLPLIYLTFWQRRGHSFERCAG
jgi:hypothetical protein